MSMKRLTIGAMFVSLLAAGCGGGELDAFGCRSDSDCKHDRVCVDGVCQDAGGECQTDADCPAGQSCYQGRCLGCDQDADGHNGPQCSGADCDDDNGSRHPGAKELCGDRVDNDCDGLTDPETVCGDLCAEVRCPEGYACDPDTGECVPICTPDCEGRECGPDGCGGSCGSCPPGKRCNAQGRCVAGCEDQCEQPGANACAGNAVVTCDDHDGDGCLEWSEPRPCDEGERCLDGRCTGCVPDCNGRACGPDPVCGESCGTCNPDEHCNRRGQCVPGCEDECYWDQSECLDQWSYIECGEWDGDPCTEWSPPMWCPEDAPCNPDTGRCEGGCRDECRWGESECVEPFAYIECGDFDQDPCSEWSPPFECPPDAPCDPETGRCGGGCWNECAWGESYCLDDLHVVECGDWDDDPCTEFGPPRPCEEGWCDPMTGRCAGECQDECAWGESYCFDEYSYVECGDFDGDGCTEFSPPMRCPEGTMCNWEAGRCDGDCRDECAPGQTQCWDEFSYVECGQWDSDPCLDWSYPMECPIYTVCDWNIGQCVEDQQCEIDGWEPDNDRQQASPLGPSEPQEHSICPMGDEDWTMFELGDDGAGVLIETSGMQGDSVMWLYDRDLNQLAYDDDGGYDLWSRITRQNLAAGAYFVRVAAYGGYQEIDAYELRLSIEGPCIPDCTGRECGPDPVCGTSCGTCPADEWCDQNGQCISEGHKEGAGDPCGYYQGCPVGWNKAHVCVEYPGSTEGFCSFPCDDASECAVDFPDGCCRWLTDGYALCLPGDLCDLDLPGYLEGCGANAPCLPDMSCVENMGGGGEQICIFTCDVAMGFCPEDGTCLNSGDDAASGMCMPVGDGRFADPCSVAEGCRSGLVCLPFDPDRPGYCNRMCSSVFPCPSPFECLLEDGQGGTWCVAPCFADSDCAALDGWSCFMMGGMGICLPE